MNVHNNYSQNCNQFPQRNHNRIKVSEILISNYPIDFSWEVNQFVSNAKPKKKHVITHAAENHNPLFLSKERLKDILIFCENSSLDHELGNYDFMTGSLWSARSYILKCIDEGKPTPKSLREIDKEIWLITAVFQQRKKEKKAYQQAKIQQRNSILNDKDEVLVEGNVFHSKEETENHAKLLIQCSEKYKSLLNKKPRKSGI